MEYDKLIDWGSSKVSAEPVKKVRFAAVGDILGKLCKSELAPNVPKNVRASAINKSSSKSRILSNGYGGAGPANTSGVPDQPLPADTSDSGIESLDRGLPPANTSGGPPPPNVANPFQDNAEKSSANQ